MVTRHGVAFRVISDIKKIMDAEEEHMRKSMKHALQIAGYRHMRAFREETSKGMLGLTPLKPYRRNPKLTGYRHAPLRTLSSGIMYGRDRQSDMRVAVGFLAYDPVFTKKTTRLQKWVHLVGIKHLEGYNYKYTPLRRKQLIRSGIYLYKETHHAVVPPRDLISAYYRRHGGEIVRDVAEYFGRKFRGEDI